MSVTIWAVVLTVFAGTVAVVPTARRPAALWLLAVLAVYPLVDLWRREYAGWDLELLCGGWQAWRAGADPYLLADLKRFTGFDLSLPYSMFWIVVLRPLCWLPAGLYKLAQLGLLAGAYGLAPRSRRADPALAALLVGGLAALYWNWLTGNHGLLELMLIGVFYRLATCGRLTLAGAVLGLLGSFKLWPLTYALALLAWKPVRGGRAVVVALAATAAVFGLVHGLSYALAPDLYPSYVARVLGLHRDLPQPLLETAVDLTNPTPWLGVAGLPDGRFWPVKTVALCGLLAAALLYPVRGFARRIQGGDSALDLASWILIVLVLAAPRVKPYSYAHLILPLWWLGRGLGPGRMLAMVTGAVVPAALHFVLAPRIDVPAALAHLAASVQALAAVTVALWCGWSRIGGRERPENRL